LITFGRLDGHLVRELGHRDGFRHVHFEDARLDRRGLLVVVAVAMVLAATGAAAPGVAADTAGRIAAGLDFLLLRRVVGPAGDSLADLTSLPGAGTGRAQRARRGAALAPAACAACP
jgi:hypothetical protein